jgi:hypothetical protein
VGSRRRRPTKRDAANIWTLSAWCSRVQITRSLECSGSMAVRRLAGVHGRGTTRPTCLAERRGLLRSTNDRRAIAGNSLPQPQSQNLSDLSHLNLPEAHRRLPGRLVSQVATQSQRRRCWWMLREVPSLAKVVPCCGRNVLPSGPNAVGRRQSPDAPNLTIPVPRSHGLADRCPRTSVVTAALRPQGGWCANRSMNKGSWVL